MTKHTKPTKHLSELIDGISTYPAHHVVADPVITGLCLDSRLLQAGDCFFAYPGSVTDGRQYIQQALDAGASMVLYEPHPDIKPASNCVPVLNIQQHIGTIASRFWSNAQAKLSIVGITGTNGKSTTTYWLAHCLAQVGHSSAVIGTIGNGPINNLQAATLTTPDPIALHRQLAQFADAGIKTVAMEVSSHSLSQHRVRGIPFEYAGFTNLTHEHLDYHGTMRDYAQAKSRLFDFASLKAAVINVDDQVGRQWCQTWAKPYPLVALSCADSREYFTGLPPHCQPLHATDIRREPLLQQSFHLHTPWGEGRCRIPALGLFNVYNAVLCAGLLHYQGLSWDQIQQCLATLPPVPGRMQVLQQSGQPICVVDYAHTPDALENALQSLRQVCQGKLICVFGCGGNRDQAKRPLMGKVAHRLADKLFVTNDNPRDEDPQLIYEDIVSGIGKETTIPFIACREEAISEAISQAGVDDIILVAGKGHESTQTQAGQSRLYSDVQVIQALLAQGARQ